MNKTLSVSGEVVTDDSAWLYDFFEIPYVCPKQVRETLKDMTGEDELTVEINSVGGAVFSGFEIYSLLRSACCKTVAYVQSLAASAASTIMCACDSVLLSPVAQVMIHQPATMTAGNIDQHKDSLRFLESIEESILNGYVARCGTARRSKLKSLMDAETWLSAQDAIDLGLADGLWAPDETPEKAAGAGTAAMAAGVTNGTGLHDPQEMLRRYEEAVRNGAAPVEGHPVASIVTASVDAAGIIMKPCLADKGPVCVNEAEEPEQPEIETVEVAGALEPWQMAALVEIERQR